MLAAIILFIAIAVGLSQAPVVIRGLVEEIKNTFAEVDCRMSFKTLDELYDENGNYILDESYTEILKLDEMLTEANIPHTLERFLDGWQVVYSTPIDGRVADAIEHCGSYGRDENLIEIMGLLTPEEEDEDSVLGYLTAEEVFERMSEHWNKRSDNNGE